MVVAPAVWADVASAFASWRFLRQPGWSRSEEYADGQA